MFNLLWQPIPSLPVKAPKPSVCPVLFLVWCKPGWPQNLKRYILRVFISLFMDIEDDYRLRNRFFLFKQLNVILTPPTKYSIKLVKCFSLVWYVIPLLIFGAILVLCGLFLTIQRWNIPQTTGVGMSLLCYWSECLPNGGIQWLLVKPWTSSIGRCARYCTAASWWPSKWPAK